MGVDLIVSQWGIMLKVRKFCGLGETGRCLFRVEKGKERSKVLDFFRSPYKHIQT